MTERVEIRVELRIRVDEQKHPDLDIDEILAEMDYDFSHEDAEIESEILEQIC